jgi:hypothetical protein
MRLGRDGAEVNTFGQFVLAAGLTENGAMAVETNKARKDLLIKGIVLCFIGAAVLVSPAFIRAPGFAQAAGGSSVVGWFSLVLGVVFLAQWYLRRNKP